MFLIKNKAMANDKNAKPTGNAIKDSNTKNKDFQRTEDEVDKVSKSENNQMHKKQKEAAKDPHKAKK